MSARRPRIIGADLSLTSSGLSDGQSAHVIQTAPGEPLESRLDRQVRGVVSFALSPTQWTDDFPQGRAADLAVIEAGAFSRGSQSEAAEILSALRLMVRHRLWRMGIPYVMIAPTTLKKYTTGHGTATKHQMLFAVDERHGTGFSNVKVKDGRYDLVDAYALAAMGYDHVGHPLAATWSTSAEPCRDSLNAVRWPSLLSDE